jgi:hypothetical protein
MSGEEALMLADISLTHAILTNSMEQTPLPSTKSLQFLNWPESSLHFLKLKPSLT